MLPLVTVRGLFRSLAGRHLGFGSGLRLGLGAALLVACGTPKSAEIPAPRPVHGASKALSYPSNTAAWKRFHSKRFFLSVPLPDGASWRIDDHSQPMLFASHEPTSSQLSVLATDETNLVNRHECEERARSLGWIPPSLTTIDDETVVGPESYDSRVWIALGASRGGAPLEGHVYLFGAFLKRCLLLHLTTRVALASDENVLSERLALARAGVIRGLTLDASRVRDDAAISREPRDRREQGPFKP